MCAWVALIFLDMCLFISHYPQYQSNHKRSLPRKQEADNKDKVND